MRQDVDAKACKRFRLAVLFGAAGPGLAYIRFFCEGLINRYWSGETGKFFVFEAWLKGVAFLGALAVGWWLGYPAFRLVSHIIRRCIAPSTHLESWDNATTDSLAILPYAAVLSTVVWLVFSIGEFGGWPDDVIFGGIAWLIWGWFLCTLAAGWIRAGRQNRRALSATAKSRTNPDESLVRRPAIRFGTRSLFVMLAVLSVLFAGYGRFHRHILEPRRQADAVEKQLRSLVARRPTALSSRQWESAVAWTLNLHGNSLLFVQATGPTIRRFRQRLAQKLAGDVNMDTIHWIWDEYAEICPHGADYQRFRPMMVDEIERGGGNWGLKIP